MSKIQDEIKNITSALPQGVRLVAVSKYHPASCIEEAYEAGQRIFGESHVQELREKYDLLPKDIEWHFIGHLQTNKVKYIAPYVSMIHAVDSMKLLREIDKQAERVGRTIPCLLQLHVAREETKFGFTPDECRAVTEAGEWRTLSHIRLCGLMCMASNTDDKEQVRSEFRQAYDLFRELKAGPFASNPDFKERSWGMSHDYSIAREEGSTLIRVGSKIFGERI
ncbi:MAG: YggS family pyridoxal phosphate-dependent enzyme [Paraprevotella sp.]|nr:YggS family pyridoxal phosphate-dependent enzyme [Paraprevotella sp.]